MEHHKRAIFFCCVLIATSVLFAILALLAAVTPHFAVDVATTHFLQRQTPAFLGDLLESLSQMGNPVLGICIGLTALGILAWYRLFREAFFLFLSLLGGQEIGLLIKIIVHRPRPSAMLIQTLVHYTTADSFPSGHVLFFVSFFGFLVYLCYVHLHQTPVLRVLFMSFWIVLIIAIGFSRMYVGAHWLSDVLGAYLLGFVWLSLVCICLTVTDHFR